MSEKTLREKEEQYFLHKEAELIAKLKARHEEEAKMKRLAGEFGVADERILKAFEELGLSKETVLLLHVMPLLQVAWADGSISEEEKRKIEEAARIRGVTPGTPAWERLQSGLAASPGAAMFEAALRAIRLIDQSLPEDQRQKTEQSLVELCTSVASASGGFLGLGSKVSDAEKAALERIAREFAEKHPESTRQALERK